MKNAHRLLGVTAALGVAHVAPYALSTIAYRVSSSSSCLQNRCRRLYGVGQPGRVAITFDDGPHPVGTPIILQALEALGWKATFFMVGENVRRHPDIAKEVIRAGHDIGLHGDSHETFLLKPLPQALNELRRGVETIESTTGKKVVWFRPPFGSLSASSVVATKILGLHSVLWTSWGKDWTATASPASCLTHIMQGKVSGGTILLHDGSSPQSPGNWQAAAEVLSLLAEQFGNDGITPVTLTEHLQPG